MLDFLLFKDANDNHYQFKGFKGNIMEIRRYMGVAAFIGAFSLGSARRRLGVVLVLMMAFGTFVVSTPAHATKKVYSPYVTEGEIEFESRSGYDFDSKNSQNGAWKQKFAVGYGVTDYWFTEIYGVIKKSGSTGADPEFSEVEWENKFQLTQKGEYFLDVGFLGELKYNTSGGADKAEGKLLLAKDIGKTTHRANLVLEREFGEGASNDFETGISWGSRYRYKRSFSPGFEVHSNFGSLSNGESYSEQKHQIGPVIYGHLGPVEYDVGYLVGVSDAAPDGTLKVLFEYEIDF